MRMVGEVRRDLGCVVVGVEYRGELLRPRFLSGSAGMKGTQSYGEQEKPVFMMSKTHYE